MKSLALFQNELEAEKHFPAKEKKWNTSGLNSYTFAKFTVWSLTTWNW
jgi:hypothetical protein